MKPTTPSAAGLSADDNSSSYNPTFFAVAPPAAIPREALTQYLRLFDEVDLGLATSYNNIGRVHFAQGKYVEALVNYNKALAQNLKLFGQNHPAVAESYNNIGEVCSALLEYEEAQKFYEKAVSIAVNVLGENHPATHRYHENLFKVQNRSSCLLL